MSNLDVTENGGIRVRARRFLDHLNRSGEKLNVRLFFIRFFSEGRGGWASTPRKIENEKNSSRGSSIKKGFANSFSLTSICLWMLRALTSI